ncbi:MAG TPA: hypothetical protein VF167_00925 [Longimicrobiaceae bacterium]
MLFYYLIFLFVTVFAKLILAMVMIYLLLPTDRRCGECDEETLLLEDHLLVRLVSRFTPGRLQRRWCPRCGSEAFCRPPMGRRAAAQQVSDRIPIRVPDDDLE